jgi:16S rRNA pseudouridine516 synthase
MRLDRFVQKRLACSTRTVHHLFADRQILVNGVAAHDGLQQITKFCRVEAQGKLLHAREPLYIMLNKPRGCVSATRDSKNTTVLNLINLPEKEQLHLAGRLDFNTTGLLLLTNDGSWSSRIMSPQHKRPKTYRVETSDEITAEYVKKFAEGIYFAFENLTTLPAALRILSATTAELTLYEGRYHQIKRMFGFFRNKVISLHRLSVESIALDADLAAGEYRHLTPAEVASVVPATAAPFQQTSTCRNAPPAVLACAPRAHSSVG